MDVTFDFGSDYQTPDNNYSGFPFDEERGFKNYLDDIATRHPQFAESLNSDNWDSEFPHSSFGRKRRGSDEEVQNQPAEVSAVASSEAPKQPTTKAERIDEPNLNQFGLRNTVPLGQGVCNEERQQRSMSAPPDNRAGGKPKRFISKCEIPIMNDPTENAVQKPPQEPPNAKSGNSPNVRVIPIQVEGRDEPLVNHLDTTSNFGGEVFREPVFDARLPRDFGTYQKHSPRFTHRERAYSPQPPLHAHTQHSQASQSQSQPQPQTQPQPQPHHQPHPHTQPQAQPQTQQTDETDSVSPPLPPKPEPPKDPISKVQIIQKEVEELMKQVESFSGNSRTDKQYMMLDELLTRKLISLDDIDTEGKENVRQARKDAIKSIQRCISTLENKVPVLEKNDEGTKEDNLTDSQLMEIGHPESNNSEEQAETEEGVNKVAVDPLQNLPNDLPNSESSVQLSEQSQ